MNYVPDPNTAPTDTEAKVGVRSLDELHALRREIIKKRTDLEKLFGDHRACWKEHRKQHRDLIACTIEDEMREKDPDMKPPSEAYLERRANADPRHKQFVTDTEAQFPEYEKLSTRIVEIEDLIRDRNAQIYYAGKELGLQ